MLYFYSFNNKFAIKTHTDRNIIVYMHIYAYTYRNKWFFIILQIIIEQ